MSRWSKGRRIRPPLYGIWSGIISRCYNPNCNMFYMYGARGIGVDVRWRGKGGYKNFIADMGPRPSRRHSVERKCNAEDYRPDNCCWATARTQARNRRDNHVVTFRGKTQCLTAWAADTGIGRATLQKRLDRYGWSVQRTLTTMPIAGGNYA